MAQTSAIVDALKQVLKQQGITYQKIARRLDLSEASVKRLFSEKQFSLKRLDQICEMAGLEISDLMRQLDTPAQISELTLAQEKELVSETPLLIAAVSCLNRWRFEEILANYQYTEPELIRQLARLDKMGLIELLPNNRIKPLISPDFTWKKNGPIQQFFESQVQQDFFETSFNGPGELRLFVTGMLSTHANELLQQKLKRLAQDFRHLHQEALSLPLADRHGTSLLMAIRPWELKAFVAFRREGTDKAYPD